MTCTICLLPLLVAEALFFTEIYTHGKKLNSFSAEFAPIAIFR